MMTSTDAILKAYGETESIRGTKNKSRMQLAKGCKGVKYGGNYCKRDTENNSGSVRPMHSY